jgi:hypothetical protein
MLCIADSVAAAKAEGCLKRIRAPNRSTKPLERQDESKKGDTTSAVAAKFAIGELAIEQFGFASPQG